MPVFAGDERVSRRFVLVPDSDFADDALTAIEQAGARTLSWPVACARSCERPFDLILAASPKGDLQRLRGRLVLLPHGAGFNKAIPGEGTVPSGLDPANLQPGPDGRALASFYALAHPSQLSLLATLSPGAAERAAVVGDPTLDRILESRTHRDRYRGRLGTGGRKLIVIVSTWGPQSLVKQRPGLFADLATRLPHDSYQLAALVHPNVRSELGELDLSELLSPAVEAGMIRAEPYQEWAALLIAADAVITDHGSSALYAAALDRPVIGASDGGAELLPGSPMAALLAASPRLEQPEDLEAALAAYRPGSGPALANAAFAEPGHALERLRAEVYSLLGLTPPTDPAAARPLPPPVTLPRPPGAFAVNAHLGDAGIHVERFPAHTREPAHHLAADYDLAAERQVSGAGLVYRRAGRVPSGTALSGTALSGTALSGTALSGTALSGTGHSETLTEAEWTARILSGFPSCRTAAVILSPELCVARTRDGLLLTVRIEPSDSGGRIVHTDPAAVLSAVHARLAVDPALPANITCTVGELDFQVRLVPVSSGPISNDPVSNDPVSGGPASGD